LKSKRYMKNKTTEWDDLGFDPVKDGFWATSDRIKKRLEERKMQARKARIIIGSLIAGSLIFLSVITYLLII
jgi:hypothetical protein